MEFRLSNEKKKEMAQHALDTLEMHYYREIVLLGEDPETFVAPSPSEITDPVQAASYAQVNILSEKIVNIQNIIDSIP
jgi:hypothetical protein